MAITAFAWRVNRITSQRADEIAAIAAAAVPDGSRVAPLSMTARLIGLARWLHGERPEAIHPARPPM
jgi:hypothetical protein